MPKHASYGNKNSKRTMRHTDEYTPQASQYDTHDEPIGLTQAFTPLDQTDEFSAVGSSSGRHASGFSYKPDDGSDEYPDAFESLEPVAEPPLLFEEQTQAIAPAPTRGRHGKSNKLTLSPHQKKSRRMRRILIVIMVLLVLLIGAIVYMGWQLFSEANLSASQQVQQLESTESETESLQTDPSATTDATTVTEKRTEVPDLLSILGLSESEAIAQLKRGASVVSTREVSEEGSSIVTQETVALLEEPADSRSGTPTVYLGLNADGVVVSAGYSAATASLGYGSISFAEAIETQHIIQKTLEEAGVTVSDDAITLPSDRSDYATYASDGTTVTAENCSFSGPVDINGETYEWSAVLTYNYTTSNATGNLADTIRIIYVYVDAPEAQAPVEEAAESDQSSEAGDGAAEASGAEGTAAAS